MLIWKWKSECKGKQNAKIASEVASANEFKLTNKWVIHLTNVTRFQSKV